MEKPIGVVVAFGGQTAIQADEVSWTKWGMPILGTSAEGIDIAEDRERFDALLEKFGITPAQRHGRTHPGGGSGRRRSSWAIRCCCGPRMSSAART